MEEFKCDICGKVLKNSSGLGGHKAAVHGQRRPPQPKLRDLVRDSLARVEHRLSALDGRVVALERVKLQQPLGPGTPPVGDLAEALARYLEQESRVCATTTKAELRQGRGRPYDRIRLALGVE
jgi:hypothetical protein